MAARARRSRARQAKDAAASDWIHTTHELRATAARLAADLTAARAELERALEQRKAAWEHNQRLRNHLRHRARRGRPSGGERSPPRDAYGERDYARPSSPRRGASSYDDGHDGPVAGGGYDAGGDGYGDEEATEPRPMRRDVMHLDSSRHGGSPSEPLRPDAGAEHSTLSSRHSGPLPTGLHAPPYARASIGGPSQGDDALRLSSAAPAQVVGGARPLQPAVSPRILQAAQERLNRRRPIASSALLRPPAV